MASRVVARSPGRVNLIGEHTDYNRGLCLPLAIPCATTVTAVRRDDDRLLLRSREAGTWEGDLGTSGPGQASGWAAYAAGTLWALAEAGHVVPGLDLEIESTVPVGAGLSSSAALEAAVAVSAVGMLGLELTDDLRRDLVEACRRAEAEVVGAPTGGLDQTAVLLGRQDAAILIDFDGGAVREVALPLADVGLALLVVDTRVSHAHAEGGYGSRRRECEEAAAALGVRSLREVDEAAVGHLTDDVLRRRARHVVTENGRVAAAVATIEARDWTALGDLLNASHLSMRDDFEISSPELDLTVDTALQAGAIGARMTGGGFGGSAIALVPAERADAVRRAVDTAFAAAGLGAPAHLLGTPSAPAHLVSVE